MNDHDDDGLDTVPPERWEVVLDAAGAAAARHEAYRKNRHELAERIQAARTTTGIVGFCFMVAAVLILVSGNLSAAVGFLAAAVGSFGWASALRGWCQEVER